MVWLLFSKQTKISYYGWMVPVFITNGDVKWCSHCGNQSGSSSKKKSKKELSYDSTVTSLAYIPLKDSILHKRDIGTSVFTATLLTTVRKWNQPWCPSADEWIRKMCWAYTMEFYSATKKKEICRKMEESRKYTKGGCPGSEMQVPHVPIYKEILGVNS